MAVLDELRITLRNKDKEYHEVLINVFSTNLSLKWYNALIENNAYDPADETVAEGEQKTEEPEAKKVAKKAKAKKAPKSAPKSAARTKTAGASAPRKAGGTQRGS